MKKLFVIIAVFLFASSGLLAQNEIDALRYSRLMPTGTARYVGTGGAFGAIGADFSALSNNPAGIGLYKSSEFSITPSLFEGRSESVYFGEVKEDNRFNFNLGNIGLVLVSTPNEKAALSGWKNFQFGFGINRLANFNNRISITGFNETSSYLTPYVNEANYFNYDLNDLGEFGSGLAYDAYLIGYDSLAGEYYIDMPNGQVQQSKRIETKGSIRELVFSAGANYSDRIYLGATIGVPFLRYSERSTFTEEDIDNLNNYFGDFSRIDELDTRGTGVNLKAGIIIRPADWIRIGGAIETPTFYTLSDEYTTTFDANFDTLYGNKSASAEGYYEYELTTPYKAMAGVGLIIGKNGLISADYQFIDYTAARLRAPDYDFDAENDAIRNDYLKAHNIRFGTEWRFGMLNFRGGYGISANPYKYGTESLMNSYSLGIGLRGNKAFLDFAWVRNQMDDEYYLYNAPSGADPSLSTVKIENTSVLMTFGIKF